MAGVLVYTVVIIVIGIQERQSAYGIDWLAVRRVDAGNRLDGEFWRCVTALTLHADFGHFF